MTRSTSGRHALSYDRRILLFALGAGFPGSAERGTPFHGGRVPFFGR